MRPLRMTLLAFSVCGALLAGVRPVPAASPALQAGTHVLAGVVVDTSGGALPGATVTVKAEGLSRSVITDSKGAFRLADLPAGRYRVAVDLRPFRSPDPVEVTVPGDISRALRITLELVMGGEGTEDARRRQLAAYDEAFARWQARRPAAYEFTVDVQCFCPFDQRPVTVVVEAGRGRARQALSDADTALYSRYDTIDRLFEIIRGAIAARPWWMSVEYDALFGFPTQVAIDFSSMLVDEEERFSVTGFKPLK